MAKISLKKDYMDGNILYGKDLNPNFETIETTINANDDTQAETNAEVEEALTQLKSDMTQAQTDIGELQEDVTNLESGITSGDSATLESAKSYTDTKLQGYAKTTDVPTKISQLENDDNTVKDASYVHTDNNFSDTDKSKLDSLNNYELPIASTSTLGGIKLGEGLESEADGTVNVTGGGGSGENGATFTPSVDDSGNLSWTNDKGLPNPDPVNIKGPKGDTGATGEQGETGATGAAGPQGVPGQDGTDGVTPTIGENGNWYLGETDTGKPSRGEKGEQGAQGLPGPTGPGVPTGGTIGQVLSKIGDGDYETGWKDIESGGTGITELIGTQEEPIDVRYIVEPGIYSISGYVKYFPTDIDASESSSTNRTAVSTSAFDVGIYPILAVINPRMLNENSGRFLGIYFREISTSPILYISVGNIRRDDENKKYTSYLIMNWTPMESTSSRSLSKGDFLTTQRAVSNMIETATGINTTNTLNTLQTTDKSSLIAAINELNTRLAALENPTE